MRPWTTVGVLFEVDVARRPTAPFMAPIMEADGPAPRLMRADRGYDADITPDNMEACEGATVKPTRPGLEARVKFEQPLASSAKREMSIKFSLKGS